MHKLGKIKKQNSYTSIVNLKTSSIEISHCVHTVLVKVKLIKSTETNEFPI